MVAIIDIQLTFERVQRELDARSTAFSQQNHIAWHIERLQQYVHDLVQEWERNGGRITGDGTVPPDVRFERLHAFLGPARLDFRPCAADPMGHVEFAVRDEFFGSAATRR